MKKILPMFLVTLLVACAAPQPRLHSHAEAAHSTRAESSNNNESPSSPATEAQRNDVVMYAMSLADTPYHYGGNNEDSGFDCSGFVGHVFRHELNISLPRTSQEISHVGLAIGREELQPGDLVFYNTRRHPYSHVGIYVGDGRFVHSPRSGKRIQVEAMQLPYWKSRYNGARRIR